jgi:hypothetical protein
MDIKHAILRIRDHMEVHHMAEYPRCRYITEALQMAINIMGAFEQVAWERNIALEQLEELGISLGQKIDGVYLTKEEHEKLLEYKYMYEGLCK